MQMALEQLGFGPCYHMRTAMNQYPRDCTMWLEAFQAKYGGTGVFQTEQWDQLLGNCSVSIPSLCLTPCKFWRLARLDLNRNDSLYVTCQLSRLVRSSWPHTRMPKSYLQIETSTRGINHAQRRCCRHGGTGFTRCCNISIGSRAWYTPCVRSTGNAFSQTTSKQMEKQLCVHTIPKSSTLLGEWTEKYWSSS